MPYVALATLAISAYQTAKSSSDKKKAERELSKMKHTNYGVSPELRGAYDRAQQMSRFGYTPQEKAALRQNVAQDINTNQQRALDQGGGNLARTISRMGSIANVQSENQMAMGDAQLNRQNIHYADSLAGQIQGINNMTTGEDINQYNRAQQAYGQAAAQQQENIYRAMGNAVGAGAYYQNRQDMNYGERKRRIPDEGYENDNFRFGYQ